MSWGRWGRLCVLLLLSLDSVFAFQSDELQEEDEEWGIVGSLNNQKVNLEQVTARSPRSSDGSLSTTSPDSKISFQLEHSFGDIADFAPAGTFSARLRTLHHGGQTLTKLRLSRSSLTSEEQEAFKALVKEDGFYRIRLPANVLGSSQETILSSVKARCLVADVLRERFDFYLDRGNIIAVGYGGRDCAYPRKLKYPTHWTFDSHIVLKSGEQAARSALAVESDVEVELDEDGQPKKLVEKSFWAKYWIYIVPLGLIFMNQIVQVANMADVPTSQSGTPQRAGALQDDLQKLPLGLNELWPCHIKNKHHKRGKTQPALCPIIRFWEEGEATLVGDDAILQNWGHIKVWMSSVLGGQKVYPLITRLLISPLDRGLHADIYPGPPPPTSEELFEV